jgi:membrane protease YdiL (CAAX protease family)
MLLLAELPLAVVALFFLHRNGTLKEKLLPKPGDVLKGVSMAGILILAIWSGRALVMPHGSERTAWLARLYLQLGDPIILEQLWWVALVILCWAALDEIVWRAWVQGEVVKRLGTHRGLIVSSLAYALQTAPFAYLLRDATAGYNPLLPLLALGTGLGWAYLTELSEGRIVPAMISHATLAYFTLLQFRPGL